MTERWKSWKAKGRLSTRSHRSLEISHTPRDFHIPTARADRGWKKWKTKTRFPTFSTRDPRLRMRFAGLQKNQNQNALDRRQAAVPERRYSEHRRLADGRKGAGGSRRFQDHYSIRKCCGHRDVRTWTHSARLIPCGQVTHPAPAFPRAAPSASPASTTLPTVSTVSRGTSNQRTGKYVCSAGNERNPAAREMSGSCRQLTKPMPRRFRSRIIQHRHVVVRSHAALHPAALAFAAAVRTSVTTRQYASAAISGEQASRLYWSGRHPGGSRLVLAQNLFPVALRLQDQFHHLAYCAAAA